MIYCHENKEKCNRISQNSVLLLNEFPKTMARTTATAKKPLNFLDQSFVFVTTLVSQTVHSVGKVQIIANQMERQLQLFHSTGSGFCRF